MEVCNFLDITHEIFKESYFKVNSDAQSKERFMERYKKYNAQKFNIESKRLKKSNNTKSSDITCAS